MANILTENLNYVWDGQTSAEMFFRPSVQTPEFNALFTIEDRVLSKKQLNLVGNLRNIVQKYDGCARPTPSSGIDITNRTLEVTELEVFLEQCKDTFEDSVFEEVLKSGIDRNDIQGTQIESAIMNIVIDAMRRDNFDLVSFGEVGATGAAAFLDKFNGLWTKLIAGVSTYEVERIGGALGQDPLAADVALNRLRFMYETSNKTLRGIPNRVFAVTQSIYDNLLTSYESITSGSNLQFQLLTDGTQSLTFRGVPVIPIIAWDDAIERYELSDPHRILYTVKENHAVGLNVQSDDQKVGAWYERKDRQVYFEALYRLGYQYKHNLLQAIAY